MMLTLAFSRHEKHIKKKGTPASVFVIIVSGRLSKLLARREGAVSIRERKHVMLNSHSISADEVNGVILHAYFGFVPITYLMLQFVVDYSHPGINR